MRASVGNLVGDHNIDSDVGLHVARHVPSMDWPSCARPSTGTNLASASHLLAFLTIFYG